MTTDFMETSRKLPGDIMMRPPFLMRPQQPPQPSEIWTTVFTVAMVAAGALSLFGNGVVVWTILKPSNRDRLRNIPNGLIAYLSIVDLLLSGVAVPGVLIRTHLIVKDKLACFGLLWGIFTPDRLATWGYVLVSFERFFLILFPFKYTQVVSGRRVVALIASVVVMITVLGSLMAMFTITSNWDPRFGCLLTKLVPASLDMNIQVLVLLVLETVVMVITYGSLTYVAQKHRRQISATQQMAAPSTSQQGQEVNDKGNQKKSAWQFQKSDFKVAMRCFVIVAVHLICHWPLALFATLSSNEITPREPNLQLVFVLLKFSSSAFNPYLYAKTNAQLRRSVLLQLKCKREYETTELTATTRVTREQTAGNQNEANG